MKKKGFTLVELLAVIVILAIIALIATPMILGVIEDARKGSAKSSALGYVDAVEKSSLVYAVNNGVSFKDGEYEVQGKNLLQNDNVIYTVDYKGNTATGTITISNGEVIEAKLTFLAIIDKVVEVKGNIVTIKETDEPETEKPETEEPEVVYGVTRELPMNNETYKAIVYLDPTDLTRECNASNVVSTTGTKTGCMKFYAFAETDTTYDLILDHNTTPLVAYNSEKTNTEMKEVKYELDKLVSESDWKITPRLITADEVAILTGTKETLKWDSNKISGTDDIETKVSWFYFDGTGTTYSSTDGWQRQVATTQGASKYAWMFDNTYGCTSFGCNVSDNIKYEIIGSKNYMHGYWTSTPFVGNSRFVWVVNGGGVLSYDAVYYDSNGYSVRPVITISKSVISE